MQSPNQFKQSVVQGQLDLRFNGETISCQIDASEAGTLVPGEAVKLVDSAGGIPKVEKIAADTDEIFGFINYDIKNADFKAEDACEVSRAGNIMHMTASAAIARGVEVCYANASVKVKNLVATNTIVGYALDKAAADGDLIRVVIATPSFKVAP